MLLADENGPAATKSLAEVYHLFLKIEAMCELAAAELEEKRQQLSQTLPPARPLA